MPTAPARTGPVWREIGDPLVPPSGRGPLNGETVAVKDVYAIAGFRVGAGVPAYLASAPVAGAHAPALQRLLDAGAAVRGIAQTVPFAYALDGHNPHYGTPPNPAAPDALPGGSSSGSASAVALGQASIGLGTDTAGSIRVPASYQGLWGLRTTHGAVPTDGVLPLAPDFDTVGLLTRTPELLARAAAVLLGGTHSTPGTALLHWDEVQVPELADWQEAFRVHQAFQAWQAHGAWLDAHPGAATGAVAERFAIAAAVTVAADAAARATLAAARAQLDGLLGDRVLIMPSASGPAPRRDATAEQLQASRTATLRLTCLAGITGRPVVAAPHGVIDGAPVGTSYLGARGSDLALITIAAGPSS